MSTKVSLYICSFSSIFFLVVFIVSITNGIVSEKRNKDVSKLHENYVNKIINENDFLRIKISNPQLYMKTIDCFNKNIFLTKELFNTITDASYKIGFFSLIISIHQAVILYLLMKRGGCINS